jgi:hypothetical protein
MILDGVDWVVRRSHHVQIDQDRLVFVAGELDLDRLRLPDWQVPVVPSWRDERLVDFFLLFNSINFCYWGQPKWTISFQEQPYDGAFGMMAALTRALDEGYPLLDGAFLARIRVDEFRHMLRGNVPIPLEAERYAILQETGTVLVSEFGGRWHEVVRQAGGSAVRLVELLIAHFPSWDDVTQFEGRRVAFYKRAQLAAGMIYQAFGGQGWGVFKDLSQLTVYADYKLPQVLRKLGILVYDEALSTLVDSQTPIPAGSRMEIEIRAATIWAGERIRQALAGRAPEITAAHIDFWLWETSQRKSPDDRPYHRTLTTAY